MTTPSTIHGPTIQTYSGQYFDLVNPDPATICIEDIAQGLANVCRFAGQCRRFYSVAQHSVLVSRLVPEDLALAALLHDAAEAYCGDVTAPLKSVLPEYRRIQRSIEQAIALRFGLYAWDAPEIKRADLVALATERRDLMPPCLAQWECLVGVECVPEMIQPHSPAGSKYFFLQRYEELGGVR